MSNDSQVSCYTFDDDNYPANQLDDELMAPKGVQSQHQPLSRFSPERTYNSRQSQPDVFRRINSIVPSCREEDSIIIEDDCKIQQLMGPQVLTHSGMFAEMEDSHMPSENATQPIMPEEEVISYVVSGSVPQNRFSDPTIRQLRSSTESQMSMDSQPRRLTVQHKGLQEQHEHKRISMFLPIKSPLQDVQEETPQNLGNNSFMDLPLNQAVSFNLLTLSQQQSQYLRSVSGNQSLVQQWADELVAIIRQYLHELADQAQKQFSFEGSASLSHLDDSTSPDINQKVLKRVFEILFPLALGGLSPINKQLSPKFEPLSNPELGDDKHRAELEALRQDIERLQQKADIDEYRIMEYYENEQKAIKAKNELNFTLKQCQVDLGKRMKEIESLNSFIANLTKDFQEQHQGIIQEKDDLDHQCQELVSTNKFLEKVITDKNDQLAKLQNELQQQKTDFLEQVRDRDMQMQAIQKQYLDLSTNFQMGRSHVSDVQEKLEQVTREKEDLEREMAILQHRVDSFEIRRKNTEQLKEYEEKVVDIEKQLVFYRSKLDDLIDVKEQKQHPSYAQFLSARAQNQSQPRNRDFEKTEQSFNLKSVQTQGSQMAKENEDSSRFMQETIPKVPHYVKLTKVNRAGVVVCSSLSTSVNRISPRNDSTLVSPFKKKPNSQSRPTPQKVNNYLQATVSPTYKGDRHQGMRHGRGKQVYPDGTSYQGGWQYDKKEGFGTLKVGDKEVYSGHWHNDQKHGCGHLQNLAPCGTPLSVDYCDLNNAPWISYQGEFKEDQFNGFGVLYFPSNERFHGVFKNGRPNGKGTFYRIDDQILPGRWMNGKFKQ